VNIFVNHSPEEFVVENGRLTGMKFEVVEWHESASTGRLESTTTGHVVLPADDVILAIGQENAFPFIEAETGIELDKWHVPKVDPVTFECTRPGVFFGGDSAFGPKNIIWAVEHGHQAAISIHKYCQGRSLSERLADSVSLSSTKMGLHEWAYSNDYNSKERRLIPHVSLKERFERLDIEVELGFTAGQTAEEAQRCLNCDVQTVFIDHLCIECDACIDICPVNCLTITHNGEEDELRDRLSAPAVNRSQALFVSGGLPQTGRVMVKDEDLCVHCGLCAERCPTAAWDMQKSTLHRPYAIDEDVACSKRKIA
jgi:ferredoxin